MKKIIAAAALAGLATVAAPAIADDHGMKAKVVETNARGKATKVEIEGKVYDVCTSDNSDGCINPREAGLKWGNYSMKYWPGEPISRKR